ncbi:MAG: hypothetical protein ACKOWF_07970 [Chloroflexota bacterium]
MDDTRFDDASRALGAAISRRSGVAALAALLGAAAAERAGARRRKPARPEGPCGDGSRKDNVCTKDSQCCTGNCDKSLSLTNRDGKGRCRCVRWGEKCTPEQTCCGKNVCTDKRCGPPPPACAPAGAACAVDADCCDGQPCGGGNVCGGPLLPVGTPCVAGVDKCEAGTCQEYSQSMQDFSVVGTFCSLNNGARCTPGEFPVLDCHGGWCWPIGEVCGDFFFEQACTAQTDTCAGTSVYVLLPMYLCGVSVSGRAATMVPGDFGSSCAADTDCAYNEVCVHVPQNSQCTATFNIPAGNTCVTGFFFCTQSSDCPVKAALTASCPTGYCQYA